MRRFVGQRGHQLRARRLLVDEAQRHRPVHDFTPRIEDGADTDRTLRQKRAHENVAAVDSNSADLICDSDDKLTAVLGLAQDSGHWPGRGAVDTAGVLLGEAGADTITARGSQDHVSGGGNGNAVDVGDNLMDVFTNEIDDAYVFDFDALIAGL